MYLAPHGTIKEQIQLITHKSTFVREMACKNLMIANENGVFDIIDESEECRKGSSIITIKKDNIKKLVSNMSEDNTQNK